MNEFGGILSWRKDSQEEYCRERYFFWASLMLLIDGAARGELACNDVIGFGVDINNKIVLFDYILRRNLMEIPCAGIYHLDALCLDLLRLIQVL